MPSKEENKAPQQEKDKQESTVTKVQEVKYDPDWHLNVPSDWPIRFGELNDRGSNRLIINNTTRYPARIGIRNHELGLRIGREFFIGAESEKVVKVPNSWCWVVIQLASNPKTTYSTKRFQFWRGNEVTVTID